MKTDGIYKASSKDRKNIFYCDIVFIFNNMACGSYECEVLTLLHREEFETIYKQNTMMGEIDYLKVLEYSEEYARVYYVSENRSAGDILSFVKQGDKWKYDNWERTVWSATGSASEVIWPYWWHFIYGGL